MLPRFGRPLALYATERLGVGGGWGSVRGALAENRVGGAEEVENAT